MGAWFIAVQEMKPEEAFKDFRQRIEFYKARQRYSRTRAQRLQQWLQRRDAARMRAAAAADCAPPLVPTPPMTAVGL